MIGRDYEQYLISTASAKQHSFPFGLWLAVTGVGLILPLVGYILRN